MSHFALIVFFSSFFLWWMLFLLMQRFLDLNPIFVLRSEVLKRDQKLSEQLGREVQVHIRSSKSLDRSGNIRMEQMAHVQYIKGLACLIMVGASLYPFLGDDPFGEYARIFVNFDETVIHENFIQFAAAIILSWYLFETVVLLQYYRLYWSSILHHWLTSISAISILMGFFNPSAILYGLTMVAWVFPRPFVLGFRLQFGHKYPNLTSKVHRFTYFYFLGTLLVNIIGQLAMLYQGYTVGAFSITYVIIILVFIGAWCYDDAEVIKSLKSASRRAYEHLDFNRIKL